MWFLERSHRFFSKWAKKIFISFQETTRYLSGNHIIVTENPIRHTFIKDTLYEKVEKLNLKNHPLDLAFGGSQAAEFINNLLFQNREFWLKGKRTLIHLVGKTFSAANRRIW